MIQLYKMIFWLHPKQRSVDEVSQILYSIFHCLAMYDEEILPRYRTAKRKKDAFEIDVSKESFTRIVLDIVNNLHTPDDVYTIGFFSSFKEEESIGLSCTFGNLPTQQCNAITIQLPPEFSGLTDRVDQLYKLFQNLTEVLRPFFACIKNNGNSQIADILWDEKPTYVHWINFYSTETAEKIGIKRINGIAQAEYKSYGTYLRILKEPLNVENDEHLRVQLCLSKKMGLL